MTLTPALENTIRLLRSSFPYRIIYVCEDKDTKEVSAYAVSSMRLPNKLAREGHDVAVIK